MTLAAKGGSDIASRERLCALVPAGQNIAHLETHSGHLTRQPVNQKRWTVSWQQTCAKQTICRDTGIPLNLGL